MIQTISNTIRRALKSVQGGLRLSADAAHQGASLTSRELASWLPSQGSAGADLLPDLPTLVARSRDLIRNHGIASGATQTLVDNVVGGGLRLSATPDYRALGKDKDWAEEWSQQVESLWRSWAETTECDASNSLTFAGLTAQVFRAALLNGEALALPLWMPQPNMRFASRVQVIESDRLSNPNLRMDTTNLRGGIEIDKFGAPVAYWLRKSHPGDALLGGALFGGEWERVPAFTAWGRRRVIHVHDKERTGQTRGKPILSAVFQQFKMLDHYQRTELQAAVVNAMVAAVIETPLDSQSIAEMMGGDANAYLSAKNEYRVQLKGGAVIPLYPGDQLKPFTPARPASQYSMFVETVLRHIGTALGLPYELLLKDFSKTNYSSARAALLEAWRFFRGRRQWLATHWAMPVYELWLEEAVNLGLVEAPDFYGSRYAYTRAKWIGPGRGWIDPVKEAQAAQIRMDAGISTLEDECAEQGLDWEEVLEERARERARMEELGLLEAAVESSRRPVVNQPEERVA